MKKYLLFGRVQGIGGWQLYCDARVAYLAECGYCVFVCSETVDSGEIKLSNLTEVSSKQIAELRPWIYEFSRRQVSEVVETLLSFIDYRKGDQVFIESTTMYYALWAELVAEKTAGVHFTYLLNSRSEKVPEGVKRFLLKKYEQGLLAGMTDKTLPDLFGDSFFSNGEERRGIAASWRDPIGSNPAMSEVIDQARQSISPEAKVIGYFGNLEKPHFPMLCDFMVEYSNCNASSSFLFLSIGSSNNGFAEEYQKKKLADCENCECFNIPELYPVPRECFEMLDVCIASWGCSNTSARAGARTIRLIDDISIKPQGVVGINLRSFPLHKCKCGVESLDELLNKLLFGDWKDATINWQIPNQEDYHVAHQREDEFVKPFSDEARQDSYYDTQAIMTRGLTSVLRAVSYHIIGGKRTIALINRIKRFTNAK